MVHVVAQLFARNVLFVALINLGDLILSSSASPPPPILLSLSPHRELFISNGQEFVDNLRGLEDDMDIELVLVKDASLRNATISTIPVTLPVATMSLAISGSPATGTTLDLAGHSRVLVSGSLCCLQPVQFLIHASA